MYRQAVSTVLLMLACCWQEALGQASVEKFGHLTVTAVDTVVFNIARRTFDTLQVTKSIEWNTAAGTARKRWEAQRSTSHRVAPSDFINGQKSSWYDMYWFRYLYPSMGADGQPIVLSALAAFPDEDPGYMNNVVVGCHVTITSNKEAPFGILQNRQQDDRCGHAYVSRFIRYDHSQVGEPAGSPARQRRKACTFATANASCRNECSPSAIRDLKLTAPSHQA